MIVIVDTNAYHRDVFASGQDFVTLFRWLAEAPDKRELWTPRGVVEELVRQYDERRERIVKVVKVVEHDLSAFGLERPKHREDAPANSDLYRVAIEGRLNGPGRTVAPYPIDVGKAIDWAAARRHPVKPVFPPLAQGEKDMTHFRKSRPVPVTGIVDASIWLTVVEAARTRRPVVLVTSNSDDFAAPVAKAKKGETAPPPVLHPLLVEELKASGVDPANVTLLRTVRDFVVEYVPKPAQTQAEAFLGDSGTHAALVNDIEDVATWTSLNADDEVWGWPVEVDEAVVASLVVSDVVLDRAEPVESGFFMTLEVYGTAQVDLMIHKSEVPGLPDDGPVAVYEADWNESMAAAEAEVEVLLRVEAYVRGVDEQSLSLMIEAIEPA